MILVMVNADELKKKQKEKKEKKIKTFEKIYGNLEKKIIMASSSDYYYLWFEVPEYIIGQPFYKLYDCKEYLEKKLRENNFNTEFYDPNFLLVKWFE